MNKKPDSIDAIRARHVDAYALHGHRYCSCGKPWPCDTAIVLAALEDYAQQVTALAERQAKVLPDIETRWRTCWDALKAAEAREARLRAALDSAVAAQVRLTHHPVTNPMIPTADSEAARLRRLGADPDDNTTATTPEGE